MQTLAEAAPQAAAQLGWGNQIQGDIIDLKVGAGIVVTVVVIDRFITALPKGERFGKSNDELGEVGEDRTRRNCDGRGGREISDQLLSCSD